MEEVDYTEDLMYLRDMKGTHALRAPRVAAADSAKPSAFAEENARQNAEASRRRSAADFKPALGRKAPVEVPAYARDPNFVKRGGGSSSLHQAALLCIVAACAVFNSA